MKFAIAIFGAPNSSQASLSGLRFAEAVIRSGHELYRVFFYHDGVLTGSTLNVPPQDEINLHTQWRDFAVNTETELVVCIASALRRGMLDETEALRHEKQGKSLDPVFIVSGLGQLVDAGLQAERLITFR